MESKNGKLKKAVDEKQAKVEVNWLLSLQFVVFLLPASDVDLLSVTSFLKKGKVGMRDRIQSDNFLLIYVWLFSNYFLQQQNLNRHIT